VTRRVSTGLTPSVLAWPTAAVTGPWVEPGTADKTIAREWHRCTSAGLCRSPQVAVALALGACDPDAGTAAPPPTSSEAASPSVGAAARAKAAAKKEGAAKAAAEEKAAAKAAAEKKAKAAAAEKAASGWTVTYVVDGDTVDVTKGGMRERIRIAGIDSPERRECGYSRATDHMINLVYGKTVTLSTTGKQDNRDRYGRLIRYLDVGKADAGYRQIKDGYAIARYDSRDGSGWHTRENRYVSADNASGKAYTCSTPKPPPPPTTTTRNTAERLRAGSTWQNLDWSSPSQTAPPTDPRESTPPEGRQRDLGHQRPLNPDHPPECATRPGNPCRCTGSPLGLMLRAGCRRPCPCRALASTSWRSPSATATPRTSSTRGHPQPVRSADAGLGARGTGRLRHRKPRVRPLAHPEITPAYGNLLAPISRNTTTSPACSQSLRSGARGSWSCPLSGVPRPKTDGLQGARSRTRL
jgi:endonuclease YncB( thermonuclease family)